MPLGLSPALLVRWNINTGECFKTLQVKQPYEGMNITGTTGITKVQLDNLQELGALVIN